MTDDLVSILIVDDEAADGQLLAGNLEGKVRAEVSHPDEVEVDDILGASLILVDYDLGGWPKSGGNSPSRQPADGLALAGVLRSAWITATRSKPVDKPVAFALYSAQLKRISGGFSDDVREHAIARLNNLEWVFSKKDLPGHPPLAERVAALAEAVRLLPAAWPDEIDERSPALATMLSYQKDQPAGESCWEEVLACRPPVNELALASRGLAPLRWLAHRILPYPCFLSDDRTVALRLGVQTTWLRDVMPDPSNALAVALNATRYEGALSELEGPRWWRAGVESLAWQWQGGAPDTAALHAELEKLADRKVEPLMTQRPVPVIDANYSRLDEPVDLDAAVRVAPDDWPPYADQAWMERRRVKPSARLKSLVVHDDLASLT